MRERRIPVLDMACGIPSHLGNPSTEHHQTPVGNAIKEKGTKQATGEV